jgi:hypothetical protein
MSRLANVKVNARWKANLIALGERRFISEVHELKICPMASMAEAINYQIEYDNFTGNRRGEGVLETHLRIISGARGGDPKTLQRAMSISDRLIDETIILDPRLARRSRWTRSDDGIFADAGLVAEGDDSPCYNMARHEVNASTAAGEPIRIVISTDSSNPTIEGLAAFIATIRLIQQFQPVHVIWQGAWLADDGRDVGHIITAPLVTGDMDFSRVQYVLSDTTRDVLSFACASHFLNLDKVIINGNGRHANRSFIGGKFLDKEGIAPTPEAIASMAAYWLGWDSRYENEYKTEEATVAALQTIPPPPREETRPDNRTKAEEEAEEKRARKNWEEWKRTQDQQTAEQAKARLANLT